MEYGIRRRKTVEDRKICRGIYARKAGLKSRVIPLKIILTGIKWNQRDVWFIPGVLNK